jgi:microcystin degradation protein MlrC
MAGETVLVGGFAHETNTFADDPTDRAAFQRRSEHFGDEVTETFRGTDTVDGGVVAVADEEDLDLIQTVSASATPGGLVTEAAYEFYTDQIVDGARENADAIDGVVLNLHGAMVPEGREDGEGPLLAAVREAVGEDTPIAVTHDLHGNVTDQTVETADVLIAYETYPHVDMGATGRRATRLLLETIRGEHDPTTAVERVPVLAFGPKQNTREGPMADLMARARDLETRDGVLKVNVFPAFHAADVPSMTASIPVVTDDDPGLAREVAREMATAYWEARESLVGDYPTPEEAVEEARELAADLGPEDGPVVLADVGDNPGGGGAADGTTVLRALLSQEVTDAAVAILRDPEAVAACVDAGVGERVTLTLGGKTDDRHGDPIEGLDGYVAAITDGEYVNTGPMGTGSENHLGRTVRFECGADDGVTVVVTENRIQPLDAEVFRHVGVQPERPSVLVVKSTNHYRADYEPLASHVLPVDSPGLSTMNPERHDYTAVSRPQYPVDEMDDDEYPTW